MYQVLPDIYCLEGLSIVNVYLLVTPEGLTLVDSGMASHAAKIVEQISKGGFKMADLHRIVLTHSHPDHAGSAAALSNQSGAWIIAHRDEVPFIEQKAVLQTKPGLMHSVMDLAGRFMPGITPCYVDTALVEGDEIPGTGGFRAVHTPGHTPGCLSLYHPEKKLIICGDAVFNLHPLTRRKGLRLPLAALTTDSNQAKESVRKMAGMDIEILLCGHGAPVTEHASQRLRGLV
jgi:glyoxylase-like metal-dependent hydrolase (beta-lactamase superfamily II)